MDALVQLADADLAAILASMRSGRLVPPFGPIALRHLVAEPNCRRVADDLQRLVDEGFTPAQTVAVLDLLARDRARRSAGEAPLELVTTGPESPHAVTRDTAAVLAEMFTDARQSVVVVGYSVYQGRQVFRTLADRMQDRPDLLVRMFLNIQRDRTDTSAASELVRRFVHEFKTRQWPMDRRLPDVFYDPRAVEPAAEKRASLHAKCVVVDRRRVFVSSANFTEAAQERNIEVGLLADNPGLADRITKHFDALVDAQVLKPALQSTS